MIAVSREDATVAIEGDGAELRTKDLGQYTVAFARLAQGVDLARPSSGSRTTCARARTGAT